MIPEEELAKLKLEIDNLPAPERAKYLDNFMLAHDVIVERTFPSWRLFAVLTVSNVYAPTYDPNGFSA